ncbi:MAG: hypothetical protein LC749_01525 [Actinobacteria bacterium]|nr:hypothetical protein [Actinomycetota bacterium]
MICNTVDDNVQPKFLGYWTRVDAPLDATTAARECPGQRNGRELSLPAVDQELAWTTVHAVSP